MPSPSSSRATGLPLEAVAAMVVVVVASNWLVQFPINDWLTWGAFSYPMAFLVSDLTNRWYGPARARQVALVGFAIGVVLSYLLSDARIALASGLAFLSSQLLDITIFDRMRRASWWKAPLVGSVLASTWDTAVFFSGAFAFTGLPWISWAIGDLAVKLAMALVLLVPFRAIMNLRAPVPGATPPLPSS
ncbi:MAG TPA: VUT family protein [Geminicoccus sp.]|nr:VUT family protein [Geminicoccus sp.]HEX2526222.1 VUT family protein [Geminicoccus sp.]